MTYPEVTPEDSFTKKERWYTKKQKEELRNRMKNLKHKEYQKLRIMVPSIAFKPNVSKVTVIEEAVRYIDHLHVALLTKLEEQESKTSLQTDSVGTNCVTEQGLSRAGKTALDLVKKADFSLYSKLREEMQAFATKTFCFTRELEYEDEFDVECMMKGPVDCAMK